MHNYLTGRIRAVIALALLAMSDGGAQLLDALIFHRHPVVQIDVVRVNGGDHCHSEQCDLGTPIAPPPPVAAPITISRFVAVTFRIAPVAQIDAPRYSLPSAPLGSRAPPATS